MGHTRFDIVEGLTRLKTKAVVAVAATSLALVGAAHAAAPAVIYDNIPDPQPGNVPSQAFEGALTNEFGGQVGLVGANRDNPTVTVLMSSFACESGKWNHADCVTTPGATFSHPVTLNVYDVGAGDSVGSLITTSTQTFAMPYRPSYDPTNCPGPGAWYSSTDATCNNGMAFTISFDLNGTTLPGNVILGVTFNTSHQGYAPIGTATACYGTVEGCPYDSLNVGTNPSPSVGTALPSLDDAYLNASKGPNHYCDEGAGGTKVFRLDAGCWTGYLPAFEVEVMAPGKDDCKKGGWKSLTDDSGEPFRNQGDCVSYFARGDG